MNFLDLVPKWLLLAALVGAGAFAGWQTYELSEARQSIVNAKDEVAVLKGAISESDRQAALQSAAYQTKVIEAQNDGKKREIALRSVADSARTESDGLRNDVANLRGQLDGATKDAAVERATAIGTVLSQCAARHQVLAERCDRHVNDLRTLTDAWPR